MGVSVICVVCGPDWGFGSGFEFGIFGVKGGPAGPEFSGAGLPPECEGFADVGVECEVLVDVFMGGLGNVFDEPCGGFMELLAGRVEVFGCERQPFEMVSGRDDTFGNFFLRIGEFEAVGAVEPVGVP